MTIHTPNTPHTLSHLSGSAVTEDDIADYLSRTPDFFQRHAELLAAVQFTSPHSHRTVSLQERQAEMLREKIKLLEQRVMEMVRNGNENVILSDKILRWACTLFASLDPVALPEQVVQDLTDRFSIPQVGLRLWDVAPAYAGESFAQGVSEDAKVFASSLVEPFCGLNTGFEVVQCLPDPSAAVSLALIPLRTVLAGSAPQPVFGILVLASGDAHRFSSGMGTDFLSRVGELASAVLSRLR